MINPPPSGYPTQKSARFKFFFASCCPKFFHPGRNEVALFCTLPGSGRSSSLTRCPLSRYLGSLCTHHPLAHAVLSHALSSPLSSDLTARTRTKRPVSLCTPLKTTRRHLSPRVRCDRSSLPPGRAPANGRSSPYSASPCPISPADARTARPLLTLLRLSRHSVSRLRWTPRGIACYAAVRP